MQSTLLFFLVIPLKCWFIINHSQTVFATPVSKVLLTCQSSISNRYLYFKWNRRVDSVCGGFHCVNILCYTRTNDWNGSFLLSVICRTWMLGSLTVQLWNDCDNAATVCNTGAEINMQLRNTFWYFVVVLDIHQHLLWNSISLLDLKYLSSTI